jgi:hypothetical protein
MRRGLSRIDAEAAGPAAPNYKQPQGGPLTAVRLRTRRLILAGLAGSLDCDTADRRVVMRNAGGDALDAVIAAVGVPPRTRRPPTMHRSQAIPDTHARPDYTCRPGGVTSRPRTLSASQGPSPACAGEGGSSSKHSDPRRGYAGHALQFAAVAWATLQPFFGFLQGAWLVWQLFFTTVPQVNLQHVTCAAWTWPTEPTSNPATAIAPAPSQPRNPRRETLAPAFSASLLIFSIIPTSFAVELERNTHAPP